MKPEAGWYPVKLETLSGGGCVLHWQDLSAVRFDDPFFEDTVRRARRGGELRQTVFGENDMPALPPSLPPSAFIFHASRSGSTLLTQWLSGLAGCCALSEPPVLDEVLQLPEAHGAKIALLRHVVRALGQSRGAGSRHFFIKHDSWHLPWLPLLQEAFPGTPCFFVFRPPEEILWSHHRLRGSQMVPGLLDPALFDMEPGSIDPADLDGYAARVLVSVFAHAVEQVNAGRLVPLEYRQFSQDPAGTMARLGVSLTAEEAESLQARSRYHSKRGGDPFQQEGERQHLSAALRARFEALAAPRLRLLYEQLSGHTVQRSQQQQGLAKA